MVLGMGLAGSLAALTALSPVSGQEYQRIPAAIHLHSTFSNGIYSPGQLVEIAQSAGIRVVIVTDHDTMRFDFGLPLMPWLTSRIAWPIIASMMDHGTSISEEGSEDYLSRLEAVGREYPEMVVLPGVEAIPFFYWKGDLWDGTLTLARGNEHIMVIGLESQEDFVKNLFGLTPISPPGGRVRKYFHHIIRLPYVLPDLGLITQPCLNIIDALTGQTHREWDGRGRICNALIAGDQVTATDACGAHLMGHDPTTDWPTPPFRRDRNHLLIAAKRGFGTVDLNEIDFESEVRAPLAEFDSAETDTPETVLSWRKTTCEQALFYLDQKKDIVDRFRGEFVFLQDGKVVWSGDNPYRLPSRRQLCGDHKEKALWLKLVDPDEVEGEQYQVYDQVLAGMAA